MSSSATETSYAPCLICQTENAPEQLLCRECSAPMSLTHATVGSDREPRIVSILGDSNVGKTVFLGFLLDMLAQRAKQFEAIPRGAHSINLQQTVISHMAWRMFPPKTPTEANRWNWSYYEVCKRGRNQKWIDLVTPDMAGEAIAAEVASPSTFRIVQKLLGRSAGLMLLVDAAQAAHGSTQPDFFALKMMSYIGELFPAKRNQRVQMPIAIVMTKADYVPACFDDPAGFAEANLNRLWNMCQSRFANVEYFASSVVGSLGFATSQTDAADVTAVPLHTALRGVLEPFEWIAERL